MIPEDWFKALKITFDTLTAVNRLTGEPKTQSTLSNSNSTCTDTTNPTAVVPSGSGASISTQTGRLDKLYEKLKIFSGSDGKLETQIHSIIPKFEAQVEKDLWSITTYRESDEKVFEQPELELVLWDLVPDLASILCSLTSDINRVNQDGEELEDQSACFDATAHQRLVVKNLIDRQKESVKLLQQLRGYAEESTHIKGQFGDTEVAQGEASDLTESLFDKVAEEMDQQEFFGVKLKAQLDSIDNARSSVS